jgi:iron(III) transport system substrate-binding protein
MTKRSRFTLLLCALLAGVSLAACGGSADEGTGSGDDPGPEGVTVYSGRTPGLIGPAIDLYEEREGVDVQTRFGESAALATTLIEEGENSPADLFFSQDAASLDAVAAEGLLLELPEDILREVPARFRSADGYWVGISARSRIVAYDGRELDEEDLPESVLEFAEPEWEGRVGWAPTNASLQAYVTALRAIEGEEVARDWLEGMVANGTQAYESNTPVRDAIAAGEIDVGLINHYYVAMAIAEEGPDYPVEIYFPPGDLGSMINNAGAGVLASSERPEEAFDFIRFMLSAPAQEYFVESSHEYATVPGNPEPTGAPPLAEIPAPDVDLSALTDLEGTLALMQETGAL